MFTGTKAEGSIFDLKNTGHESNEHPTGIQAVYDADVVCRPICKNYGKRLELNCNISKFLFF